MEILIGIMVLLSIMGGVMHYLDLGVSKKLVQLGSDKWDTHKRIKEADRLTKESEAAFASAKLLQKAAKRKETLKELLNTRRELFNTKKASQPDILEQTTGNWHSNVGVTSSGGTYVKDIGELLSSPEVQKQLTAMDQLFKGEVLRALRFGKKPPLLVGRGTYTKETLKRDWDDDWQAVADDLDIHLWPKAVGSPALSPLAENIFAVEKPRPTNRRPSRPPPPPNPPTSHSQEHQKLKFEIEKLKAENESLKYSSAGGTVTTVRTQDYPQKIFSAIAPLADRGITLDKDGFLRETTVRTK